MPVAMPTTEGRPNLRHSIIIQTSEATAAEICVTKRAIAAFWPAARAEPPLKPNQPTHNIQAPIIVKIGLCGGCTEEGKLRRLPTTIAATNAAVPAVA